MNKAKKGQKKEKLCRDQLQKDGWFVVFKSIRWRFGCIDFANMFDVVAYKGKERKFISCKHLNGYYLPHQEDIRRFKETHGLPGEEYSLWLWDRPRWVGRGKNKKWQEAHWHIIIL